MLAATRPGSALGTSRFRTLYRLLVALNRASALEDVFDAALTGLLDATAADRAAILLFDDDGVIRFKASRGLSPEYQAAVTGHSPWPQGTRDAQPLVVADSLVDESLAGFKELLLREGILALAFVPMALNAGVFGKFMLYYAEPHECTADELEIASSIAAHVALATDRKRAEHERALLLLREQEARRTAELLNRVAPRLAAQLDIHKLVQEVTDIATALVGAEFGALFHNVANEQGESYMLYKLSGVPQEAFASFPMPRSTDLFDPTFRGEAVVRCEDVTQDPRYGKHAPHYGMPEGHLPVRSYLAAPVLARSGEVLGGLFFGHSLPGKFTETHEAIITGIAAQASIAMDNARLFEQTQWVQAELKRSNEELRLANQDLEVFAYSASHDLQEPLRTISISAEILKRNWGRGLQGEDATFLGNILTASHRMSVLTADLLAYTRAARYEQGPTPQVESARVLASVLETLKGQIEEAAATVSAGELPAVAIHESRLAQLFQNLISNAIKYRSKEAPRVHVAADERDGWCVFSVVDNGIGIEPQFAEQIFGLFKRLHGRDEYPGSGIGLAICQRVVEQYGGRIWLDRSAPGEGSTFSFALPSRTR